MGKKRNQHSDALYSIGASFDSSMILSQYDEILAGRRKVCSSVVMSKNNGNKYTNEILRYVFEDYLGMSPREVRDKLTPEIIELLKLKPFIINRIPCPAELDAMRELQYIGWHLYPYTRNVGSENLTVKVYMEILAKKRKKYPKYFFDDIAGEGRARILFKIMLNEYIMPNGVSCVEELYQLFADAKKATELLSKYALKAPLQNIYISPLEYLHEALGSQGNEELYRYYKDAVELPEPIVAQEPNRAVEIILSDVPDFNDFEILDDLEDIE
jgi:hypothetical protein